MVIISLSLDVACDRILISMLTYGADVIPVSPEYFSPKLSLDLGALPEYLPGSDALDGREDKSRLSPCNSTDSSPRFFETGSVQGNALLRPGGRTEVRELIERKGRQFSG
jgi:hypothetical protein